jgi:hypothetical protein
MRFRVWQLDTNQANHQANLTEYSILAEFVLFRLFSWLRKKRSIPFWNTLSFFNVECML